MKASELIKRLQDLMAEVPGSDPALMMRSGKEQLVVAGACWSTPDKFAIRLQNSSEVSIFKVKI